MRQPLAGEIAARRSLLERLPFATGYGVEIAMLLDVLDAVGLDGIAQVDLDSTTTATSRCSTLSAMAYAVLRVLARRGSSARDACSSSTPRRCCSASASVARRRCVERPPMSPPSSAR